MAALTARGDSGARREVLGALDDERVWVRDWMLEGIEEQLDAPTALALLREAQPALRGADARAAVSRAIGRLERTPS